MFDKAAFFKEHASEFPGYRLITAEDLKANTKLLVVDVRGNGGNIHHDVQPAELRDNFRIEGFLGPMGLEFVNMFFPEACPGGRYKPIHQKEVLATTIADATEDRDLLLTGYFLRGKIFLVHDETCEHV